MTEVEPLFDADEESVDEPEMVTFQIPRELLDMPLNRILNLLSETTGMAVVRERKKPDRKVSADVQGVYDYWIEKFYADKHPNIRPSLLDERVRVIRARLRRFSVDQLKQVIDVVAQSEFHMGKNDGNKKYIDFKNIMGSDAKVERHLACVQDIQDATKNDEVEVREIRLKLERLGAKLRTGSGVTISTGADFKTFNERLRVLTGQVFNWRTGRYDDAGES